MSKTSILLSVKALQRAGAVKKSVRPVDSNGGTPYKWADCTHWEIEDVIEQDFVDAVEKAVKEKKLKNTDLVSEDELRKAVKKEKRKPTPSEVIIDAPLEGKK